MKLRLLISLLPAAMAEYDRCARPNGEWAGFDQGYGESYGRALSFSGTNIYLAGTASGALSYATSHNNGDYYDHLGTNVGHKAHTDNGMAHHASGSVVTSSAPVAETSREGQSQFIYKLSDKGEPMGDPYTAKSEALPDGINRARPEGMNSMTDGTVLVQGVFYGKLTFPTVGGGETVLSNSPTVVGTKSVDYYDLWVASIDMAAVPPVAKWAVSIDTDAKLYGRGMVATALGHVITATDFYQAPTFKKYSVQLNKFNGADGTVVWTKTFGQIGTFRDAKMSSSGESIYLTGAFKGKDSTDYAPVMATMTSCEDGGEVSSVVAEFDVSPVDAPVAKWVTDIGCGGSRYGGKGTFVEGNYLYVVGDLTKPSTLTPATVDGVTSTAAACTMTGALGGFLVKLNKADGKCVWAKDMGAGSKRVVANAAFVWTALADDDPFKFDDTHIITPAKTDVMMGKFKAADGTGMWGAGMGGSANDGLYDMDMTPSGPVLVGYSDSNEVSVGDVTATNLQNQKADAAESGKTAGWRAMFAIQVSINDKNPSCLTCAADADVLSATIAADKCYADGQCIATGAFSPARPCYKCDAATSQKELVQVLDNHCYFGGKCIAAGAGAPHYTSYNSHSVCELCQPAVDTTAWSMKPSYFHDRDHAKDECWAPTRTKGGFNMENGPCKPNNYGLLFQRNSGGCQTLPDVPLPAAPIAALAAALAAPSFGAHAINAIIGVGARAINAITETNAATTVAGTQLVSAWYQGTQATCTKEMVDHDAVATTAAIKTGACANTPAAHADKMAALFGTGMYYGHSIARIKVQQALAILDNDLKTGITTALKADLQKDIVAHILVPMYQGAIKAAYEMDTADDKAAAQTTGAVYWDLIHTNVPGFKAADKARLTALFTDAPSGDFNYCEIKTILHRNLPDGSMLQYGQQDHQTIGGTRDDNNRPLAHASGLPTATVKHVPADEDQARNSEGRNPLGEYVDATEAVHLQERDIGVLKASQAADGADVVCTMPPPPPPPVAIKIGTETIVTTFTAAGAVSDYADTTALQEKFAKAAGVDKTMVSIKVTAASVIITVTITVPKDKVGATLQAALTTAIGETKADLAEQSAALGVTVETVTVTTVKDSAKVADPDSGLSEGEIAGIAIGAAVGGIVLLGIVGLILRSLMFKEAKPVFTCLEKSTAEKKAPPA